MIHVLLSAALAAPGDVTATLDAPGYYPTGLAWDGEALWVANLRTAYDPDDARNRERLDRVDVASGEILRTNPVTARFYHGLAWDGSHLWGDEGWDTLRMSTADGTEQRAFDAPGTAAGTEWIPAFGLVVYDDDAGQIVRIDPTDGRPIAVIVSAVPAGSGDLAWDGCSLWQTNRRDDRLYRYDLTGARIGELPAPGRAVSGLAFDGASLWVSDEDAAALYAVQAPLDCPGDATDTEVDDTEVDDTEVDDTEVDDTEVDDTPDGEPTGASLERPDCADCAAAERAPGETGCSTDGTAPSGALAALALALVARRSRRR